MPGCSPKDPRLLESGKQVPLSSGIYWYATEAMYRNQRRDARDKYFPRPL